MVSLAIAVKGCPQIKVPPNAWVTQDETKATIKCNHTEETWFLACNDHEWKGDFGNCSKGAGQKQSFYPSKRTALSLSYVASKYVMLCHVIVLCYVMSCSVM